LSDRVKYNFYILGEVWQDRINLPAENYLKKKEKLIGKYTVPHEIHFTLVTLSKSHINSRPMVRS
jgi:hypothetical protein